MREDQRKLTEYTVVVLALLGLMQIMGGVLEKYMPMMIGFGGSIVLLSVSAFGAVWLLTIIQQKRFKSRETAIAIGMIVLGIVLYQFIPESFPRIVSLIPPV